MDMLYDRDRMKRTADLSIQYDLHLPHRHQQTRQTDLLGPPAPGGSSSRGERVDVTNAYLTWNGRPFFVVGGELPSCAPSTTSRCCCGSAPLSTENGATVACRIGCTASYFKHTRTTPAISPASNSNGVLSTATGGDQRGWLTATNSTFDQGLCGARWGTCRV